MKSGSKRKFSYSIFIQLLVRNDEVDVMADSVKLMGGKFDALNIFSGDRGVSG